MKNLERKSCFKGIGRSWSWGCSPMRWIQAKGSASRPISLDRRCAAPSWVSSNRIDEAIGLQACRPHPAPIQNLLEVFQAAVPTIKNYTFRHEAPFASHLQQHPEVVVFSQGISSLVVNPIV